MSRVVAARCVLLFFIFYLAVLSGDQIAIEILSPVSESPANGSCDISYQALLNESIIFDVVATATENEDFTLLVRADGTYWPLEGCNTVYCNTKCNCTCNFSGSTHGMTGMTTYAVVASSYRGAEDSVVKVCVQYEPEVNLAIVNAPSSTVMTEDGNATLTYTAAGYPSPQRFLLSCTGLMSYSSTGGVFELNHLQPGCMYCDVTVVSRVSRLFVGSLPVAVSSPGNQTQCSSASTTASTGTTINRPDAGRSRGSIRAVGLPCLLIAALVLVGTMEIL